MNFRLFKDYRRTFWHVEAEHQNRQNLRYAKANVGDKYLLGPRCLANLDLEYLTPFTDWLNAELVNKAEVLEPVGNVLVKGQPWAPFTTGDLLTPLSRGQ